MRRVALSALAILVATATLASVFAYYPLTITATPQMPGVVFQEGSNAGRPDIGTNNLITVNIGPNKASATVRIHPTYRENYYKDVLRVYNGDDDAMAVWIVFYSVTNNLPDGSVVKMFVYEENTKVKELDITNPDTNQPINVGSIASGKTWQIDFYVYIPEGTTITNRQYTAEARLVYTPSAETPPVKPDIGR